MECALKIYVSRAHSPSPKVRQGGLGDCQGVDEWLGEGQVKKVQGDYMTKFPRDLGARPGSLGAHGAQVHLEAPRGWRRLGAAKCTEHPKDCWGGGGRFPGALEGPMRPRDGFSWPYPGLRSPTNLLIWGPVF